jgi:acyl-CoA thioesterase FadM
VVLLFRLLACLLLAPFKRRVEPLGESVLTMRVWPNDLDLNIHANSGRYVSFVDVGRIDLVARMGIMRKVLRRGWRPLVGATMISYRKSLLPFEKFRIRSRVICFDEKWFYFEHIVEKMNGELSAIATVRGLARGPNGNVPPSEFFALTGRDVLSPPIPAYIAKWRESEARE